MKSFIPKIFSSENLFSFYTILILFTVAILYFLSPKINFTQNFYFADDIIPHDIVAEQDILVKDNEASQLKTKELLSQLALIFDYDPLIYQKIQNNFDKEINILREYFTTAEQKQTQIVLLFEENKINQLNIELEKRKGEKQVSQLNEYALYLKKQKIQQNQFEIHQTNKKIQRINEQLNALSAKLLGLKENKGQIDEQSIQFNSSRTVQIKEKINLFLNNIGIKIQPESKLLYNQEFYELPLEKILADLFIDFLAQPIVNQKDISSLGKEYKKAYIINLENQEQITVENADKIKKIEEVKKEIRQKLALKITTDKLNQYHQIIETLFLQLIDASLSLNKREFEEKKHAIVHNAGNVYVSFKKGEMIARRGIKANQSKINLINSYYSEITKKRQIPQIIGILAIIIISLYLAFGILKEKYRLNVARKFLLMNLTAIFFTLFLCHSWSIISYNLALSYPLIPATALLFAMPIVVATMIMRVLADFHLSLHAAILSSLFVGIMQQFDFIVFTFALLTTVTATLPLIKFDRLAFFKHGFKISIAALCFIAIMLLIGEISFDNTLIFFVLSALLIGLLSPIFILFLMPIFEFIFDITTEIKLLELSNMNHPVLKKLLQVAPGTYQHSIMVGTIAEAGALEIGANSLLCRVAAYYHDVGKQKNPEYFIENISSGEENIHIQLKNPQQSASIIINHVSEGVKIAKENNLGSAITSIIREHHGESLVKYFYNVALKENTKIVREVYQTDYRYVGPKPQTLEAAVVMLADGAEAATRSLTKHSVGKIKTIIQKIFDDALTDGQLDESGMTFTQFKLLKDLYGQIISSIYHQRVDYHPN